MRRDAPTYPSVSWDTISFACGAASDVCEVHLLDYATLLSGGETPATVTCGISGEIPVWGTDVLHLYSRDTRNAVSQTDCRWAGTMAEDLIGSTSMQ